VEVIEECRGHVARLSRSALLDFHEERGEFQTEQTMAAEAGDFLESAAGVAFVEELGYEAGEEGGHDSGN
jgi:hypothetical protein